MELKGAAIIVFQYGNLLKYRQGRSPTTGSTFCNVMLRSCLF